MVDVQSFLTFGGNKRKFSLAPLERFASLRSLSLDGQHKNLGAIADLTSLESIRFRSIAVPDLRILENLTRLTKLSISFGGAKGLTSLAHLPALTTLTVDWVSGMTDLSPIADIESLERLSLACMPRVTVSPDLSRLTNLRSVALETMKGITDLGPLLTAPNLERVMLVNMVHLQPSDVGVLSAHPALKEVGAGLGSLRKNAEAHRLAMGTRE